MLQLTVVDRIIFCLFLDVDVQLYNSWMRHYFPRSMDASAHGLYQVRLAAEYIKICHYFSNSFFYFYVNII